MNQLKVCKLGDSVGVTLPKEVLEKMGITEGDTLYLSEVPGGIQLTRSNPAFEKVMEAYQKVNEKYGNALRKLAQ
ncbi:MAG: AbrB/MazE/SpoVT family DNA-binding domain-containing protein [Chroococcales cyanobacterium]